MESSQQSGGANFGSDTGRAPASLRSPAAAPLLLTLAAGCGAVTAVVMTLPKAWAALSCLAVCGALGAALWGAARWPLVPVLRLALLASFSFRLEINLFPIVKNHADPRGVNLSLMLILSLLLAVAHLFQRWRGERSGPVLPTAFSLTAGALFLWCLLSIVYGTEKALGGYALFGLAASLLMCFAVAAHFGTRAALRAAVICLAVMVAVSSMIGCLQSWFGLFDNWTLLGAVDEDSSMSFAEGDIARAAGLLQDTNGYAWYLVTFLPVLIAMSLLPVEGFRRWERAACAAASGLAVVALILSYARGSWASFIASVILVAALGYRMQPSRVRGPFAWKLAALGLCLAVLCLPFAGTIYTRLTEDDRGAAYSRVPLMQVALAVIEDNPVLGVGLASYETEMRRYDTTPEAISDTFDWPVHNILLHMAAETGVPGLLCFLALLALALWQGWAAFRSRDPLLRALAIGLVGSVVAYLWTGLKEPGSFGGSSLRLCFLFCGLLIAVGRASRNQA